MERVIYNGVFNQEVSQRFLRVLIDLTNIGFKELFETCLPKNPQNFKKGLERVATWSTNTILEDVTRITTMWPDSTSLYESVFVEYLKSTRGDRTKKILVNVPHFSEFCRLFLVSLSRNENVLNGVFFKDNDDIKNRVACMDACRDAFFALDVQDNVQVELRSVVSSVTPHRGSSTNIKPLEKTSEEDLKSLAESIKPSDSVSQIGRNIPYKEELLSSKKNNTIEEKSEICDEIGETNDKKRKVEERSEVGDRRRTVEERSEVSDRRRTVEEKSDVGDRRRRTVEEKSDVGDRRRRTVEEKSEVGDRRRPVEEKSEVGDRRRPVEEKSEVGDRRRPVEERSEVGDKRRPVEEKSEVGDRRRPVEEKSGLGDLRRTVEEIIEVNSHRRPVEERSEVGERRRPVEERSEVGERRRPVEERSEVGERRRPVEERSEVGRRRRTVEERYEVGSQK